MLKQAAIRLLDSENEHENKPCLKRRGFLKLAALTVGGLAASPALAGLTAPRDRILSMYSTNTGENIRTVYWTPRDGYVRDSLRQISWVLRDYRTDEVKNIDPILLDQLYTLQFIMDYNLPLHVISGYRSPATNAMLHRASGRVARNSYHIQARAMDIRMPGRRVSDLRRAAVSLQAGGVGYYPYSNFIHIDTGPIRYWS